MKPKSGKFSLFPKLERLEVYLLAADNPIGKKQLRPIFRRKRSKEVLTREQVTAIKRGRRVLRKEMKEQGIKRRIDFEVTATNLGLYFDRNGLLWPFFLWLIRDNTVAKILAMTAVLTTLVVVTQPVIEYLVEYRTRDRIRFEKEYHDRFTISVSDEMLNEGFELSENNRFNEPQEILFAPPVTQVPCVSIGSIPYDIDNDVKYPNGSATDFFHYTFYCRYINKEAEKDPENINSYKTSYQWGLKIHSEKVPSLESATDPTGPTEAQELQVSDAIWVMVIQDGEVILCAKRELGKNEQGQVVALNPILPSDEAVKTKRIAFHGRSEKYLNEKLKQIDPLLSVDNVSRLESLYPNNPNKVTDLSKQIDQMFVDEHVLNLQRVLLRTGNWKDYYEEVPGEDDPDFSYFQVKAERFKNPDKDLVVERTRKDMLPWIAGVSEEYHKYTVVAWLEGDDPQCTNELMGSYIGLNFQIVEVGGTYAESMTPSNEPTVAPEPTAAG